MTDDTPMPVTPVIPVSVDPVPAPEPKRARPAWLRLVIALAASTLIPFAIFAAGAYLTDFEATWFYGVVAFVLPAAIALVTYRGRWWVRILVAVLAFWVFLMFLFSVAIPVEHALNGDDDGGYYCC